ncbi:polyprenyl synthetase family protein [Microbispora sp. RL4-1S]|uniref:Polyprenyl synthetase family protein n=1 Tax=Microbispora oryzae TaxID=2806554 RepID=A0A941AQ38_9ACTN|nr:polyprenyl synthetase family protein [Microbispora oryzae]MBP2704324.1 polyprenyl synthetase family protein [Microbispora oryzae]
MTTEVVETLIDEIIDRVRGQIDVRLGRFLDDHPAHIADPDVAEGHRLLRQFVMDGGKRIRPILCYWGWRGAGGGDGREEPTITTGAALELYHAGLLIHDDIMDGSDLRRGRPTVHRSLARPDRRPAGQEFGHCAAVLMGVLAQAWADELLCEAGAEDAKARTVRGLFNRMRSEVISGQYLDILASTAQAADADQALMVARYKTAKYTVERPLQIGGALAGATPRLLETYTRFGLPIGEAFQLRDDVLGVFGDPAVTGKPVITDLREGKLTVLIARALAEAGGRERDYLRTWHGNPELDEPHAAELRQIIVETGALAHVESLIEQRVERALDALRDDALDGQAREALTLLAGRLTRRVR